MRNHAASLAAALKQVPGVTVEVVDGNHGELTVSVGGRAVAKKGESLPAIDEVVAAVRKETHVGASS